MNYAIFNPDSGQGQSDVSVEARKRRLKGRLELHVTRHSADDRPVFVRVALTKGVVTRTGGASEESQNSGRGNLTGRRQFIAHIFFDKLPSGDYRAEVEADELRLTGTLSVA